MKKVEIPTFLNEQPTVIFGRTGRELLIIACGSALGYDVWSNINLAGSFSSIVVHILLTALPVLLSFAVALISIAGRPLEEWAFVLLLYLFVPKVYQYVPFDAEDSLPKKQSLSMRKRALESWRENDDED